MAGESYFSSSNTDQYTDLAADGALALGIVHPQLSQAAAFYETIMNDPRYAGKEIVITGHSLGGGIGIMNSPHGQPGT